MDSCDYIVVIEWGGVHPPTSWYNQLRRLKMTVRGVSSVDKSSPVYLDRISDKGFIIQEGVILVGSHELATHLAHTASGYGAKVVVVFDAMLIEQITAGERDRLILDDRVRSSRGRPSRREGDYVITCHHCGFSVYVHGDFNQADKYTWCCRCNLLTDIVKVEVGELLAGGYMDRIKTSGDFVQRFWQTHLHRNTYFARSTWTPGCGDVGVAPDVVYTKTYDILAASTLVKQLVSLGVSDAVFTECLEAAYMCLLKERDWRVTNRSKVLGKYFLSPAARIDGIVLAVDDDDVDLLDVGMIDLYRRWRENG